MSNIDKRAYIFITKATKFQMFKANIGWKWMWIKRWFVKRYWYCRTWRIQLKSLKALQSQLPILHAPDCLINSGKRCDCYKHLLLDTNAMI